MAALPGANDILRLGAVSGQDLVVRAEALLLVPDVISLALDRKTRLQSLKGVMDRAVVGLAVDERRDGDNGTPHRMAVETLGFGLVAADAGAVADIFDVGVDIA